MPPTRAAATICFKPFSLDDALGGLADVSAPPRPSASSRSASTTRSAGSPTSASSASRSAP
jgi:hypothetical protein